MIAGPKTSGRAFGHALLTLAVFSGGAASAAERIDVAVLALRGSAPQAVRDRGTRTLIDALGGIEGLRVISLARAGEVLGQVAAEEIERCQDDACLVRATTQIRATGLIAGTIDVEPGRTIIRVRLLETSSSVGAKSAPITRARVSRDVAPEGGEGAFRGAVAGAAVDLFPDLADRTSGTLIISGLVPSATIWLDRAPAGEAPPSGATSESVLRVRAGTHVLEVRAEGHAPFHERVEVVAGHRTEVQVSLDKNRSKGPWILAGTAAAAGGIGAAFWLSGRSIAGEWQDGCRGVFCDPGFTRARYDSDRSTVDRDRIIASSALIVSGLALAGAVVWYLLDPGQKSDRESF